MTAQKKPLSEQAQVAKLIKQYCKSIGIDCRTKSDSFSMGDSVDAYLCDQPPEVVAKVETYAKQFQYGHFNGMEDIYEYSNRRKDIPQSKYVFVNVNYSDEIKQAAWDTVRARFPEAKDGPASFKEAENWRMADRWASDFVYRLLRGSLTVCGDFDPSGDFWKSRDPARPAAVPISATTSGAAIEEHTHTKGRFQMWVVVLPARVDGETFTRYLGTAKALGGWYSRKWGTTPAGFAFKDRAKAEEFAAGLDPAEAGETSEKLTADPVGKMDRSGTPTADPGKADRLRGLADKMQPEIDRCFADRLANTPKRQRQAGEARLEGERLKRTQQGLRALADLHETGAVPPDLVEVTTKKAAYELAGAELDRSSCGYYDVPIDLGRPRQNTPAALAFWDLLKPKSDEEKAADDLRRMMEKLKFASIPGFFQTPAALIKIMMERADIRPGDKCLEPEAGAGAIADQLREAGGTVDCCEVWLSLRRILEAKGHRLVAEDFLSAALPTYDRIVMNPPFEGLQDIDHVRKAFDHLAPGGRLVSVMSPGAFYRTTKKAEDFREWFYDLGGSLEEIPAGTFKESGTEVSSVLVMIDKAA